MNSTLSTFPTLAFLAAPWLLIGLILSGPFLLFLMVVVAALALPIVPLAVAIPFLLMRRTRSAETVVLRPVTA